MDHFAFPLVVGGVVTILATTFSLLPDRVDVTHVFAAYGVGTIFGEAVAARKTGLDQGGDDASLGRRIHGSRDVGLDPRPTAGHTLSMSPGEHRRFRIAIAIGAVLSGLLGLIASANDWAAGWVMLAFLAIGASAVVFVHFPPWERTRRRR